VNINSCVCIKKRVHSDNKEVIKRNQYSEIQEHTEEKYKITDTKKREKQKSEKCKITMDHTAIY
jgi:hypothetical protein